MIKLFDSLVNLINTGFDTIRENYLGYDKMFGNLDDRLESNVNCWTEKNFPGVNTYLSDSYDNSISQFSHQFDETMDKIRYNGYMNAVNALI
jgi:hypothetical protein